MHRALLLLLRLRLNSWFRRLSLTMKTARGAVLTIVSAVVVAGWMGSLIVGMFASRGRAVDPETLANVDRYAPLALVAYCLLVVLSSGGGTPIAFSQAEVQFLFSGPFTRRQVLAYKLLSAILLTLPMSLFMSFAARALAINLLQAWLGVALILIFLQLFGVAVNFVASGLGEWAYSRTRRTVMLLVLAAMVVVAIPLVRSADRPTDALAAVQRVEQSEVVQWLLMPPRWFVRVLTAQHLWPDFLLNAGLALAMDVALLGVVFALDAGYVEAAAAASERRYARIQRMRSAGVVGAGNMSGQVRYSLPDFPFWGGAGPIAWRQLVVASRGYRSLLVMLLLIALSSIGPLLGVFAEPKGDSQLGMAWALVGIGLGMSALMNQLFAFDFRSDVDRIEVLKTLPLPAWRISAGQLVAPALCTSFFQMVFVGMVWALLGHVGYGFLATVVLAPPVNFLLAGIDNLLFLLFPTRMVKTNDLSQTGRNMMLMFAKMTAIGLGIGVPVGVGAAAYFLFGHSWLAACAAAWVFAVAAAVVPVPLVAVAFRHFDVARDTPP